MRIICGTRRSGKTTSLIRLASQGIDRRQIVCCSRREVRRISEQATRMGLMILTPITFIDFLRHRHHFPPTTILIDDIRLCLNTIAGGTQIGAITLECG